MCGIAGLLPRSTGRLDTAMLSNMCAILKHRGPDDWGVALGQPGSPPSTTFESPHIGHFESARRIGLASTRLSIIDLSAAGHMPMGSHDRERWIAFNGEIYNFAALRQQLEAGGCRFRSKTDTEVILQLFEREGPECFRHLNGMFAVAIWDGVDQALYLARDRFGVKPLYYASGAEGFVFASEIKAMWGAGVSTDIDLDALNRYLTFLYVPEPETILRNVRKVPAGSWLRISSADAVPTIQPFWRLTPNTDAGRFTEPEIAEELRRKVAEAVVRQTIGDVPVSAFLSGGLDSSAIVSLMCQAGRPPASVHCIAFSPDDRRFEGGAEDVPYARRLASHLGLTLQETLLQPDLVSLLPKLVWHLDEPVADPAIIPAFLVAQSAATQSKVLLSGMGADEVFGGYRRQQVGRLLSWYAAIPPPVRRLLRRLLASSRVARGSKAATYVRYAKRLLALADVHPAKQYIEASAWMDAETRTPLFSGDVRSVLNAGLVAIRHEERLAEVSDRDAVTQALYLDTLVYLPGHNLNYTDKMSMAASVEVRVPFLDNDLVDYAFSVPSGLKIKGLQGKYILRKALTSVVPTEILNRPKTGFAAPIRSWLHRDLHDMTRDLLAPGLVGRRGLFEPRAITALLDDELSGREDRSYNVWALLSLELWMQQVTDSVKMVTA